MGLAASQARFLGLTARKSNIEYEGQQVNQQRTALAEEVNALYNSLASLALPIAPDATEFYESNYSFSLGNTSDSDGDYLIKSRYQNDDGTYYLNTTRTYKKKIADGKVVNRSTIAKETSGEGQSAVTTYKYTPIGSETAYELTKAGNSSNIIKIINETYESQLNETDELYYYIDTEGTGQTYYFSKAQMDAAEGDVSAFSISEKSVTEGKVFESVKLTFDENNRISKVKIGNQTADVDTTRVYDSDGYDAALRDYTMSKDEYNRKVQELNARTESLQQEDKILEMRLDQISTEQNELKTEMEAVKAILKDNIEKTFNTFS